MWCDLQGRQRANVNAWGNEVWRENRSAFKNIVIMMFLKTWQIRTVELKQWMIFKGKSEPAFNKTSSQVTFICMAVESDFLYKNITL